MVSTENVRVRKPVTLIEEALLKAGKVLSTCARHLGVEPESRSGGEQAPSQQRIVVAFAVVAALTGFLGIAMSPGRASGADQEFSAVPSGSVPPPATQLGETGGVTLTDPEAAAELPHDDLDRAAAANLAEATFPSQFEAPQGLMGELSGDRFLSDTAAVVPAGQLSEPSNDVTGGGPSRDYQGRTLLESTVPLRAETDSGRLAAIDLSLERSGGSLEPVNAPVEMRIPEQLNDGITLPESEITVTPGEAPDRAPSIVGDNAAFYPNVAEDSDLTVTPTATGFETSDQLRTADAPTHRAFSLDLPAGAELREPRIDGVVPIGGAEVVQNGKALLGIQPPAAVAADGESVASKLVLAADSTLEVVVFPDSPTSYPILVDPVWDTYTWKGVTKERLNGALDWFGYSNRPESLSYRFEESGSELRNGLVVGFAPNSTIYNGDWDAWYHYVPRYFEDLQSTGKAPETFISYVNLNSVGFWTSGNSAAMPGFSAGIYDAERQEYASSFSRLGNQGDLQPGANYYFPGNNHHGNKFFVGPALFDTQAGAVSSPVWRSAYSGNTSISYASVAQPVFANPAPANWTDGTSKASPIQFSVTDSGLGVQQIELKTASGGSGPITTYSKVPGYECGQYSNPCPRVWNSADPQMPPLNFDPSSFPQGVTTTKLVAREPTTMCGGSESSCPGEATVQIKIDRTAPTLSVGGTLTKISQLASPKLSLERPEYTVMPVAEDGTAGAPQSGVRKLSLQVNGKVIAEQQCTTQSCALKPTWKLESAKYLGSNVARVIAEDSVGHITEGTPLSFTIRPDTTEPQISGSAPLVPSAGGWITQKPFNVSISASDGGFGVTKEELLLDHTPIASAQQTCSTTAETGCAMAHTFGLPATKLTGGAHALEVVARDGAGNVARRSERIYVDPSGAISAAEAAATVEAVEETSPEVETLAPNEEIIDPEEVRLGNDPSLSKDGEQFSSEGTAAPSAVSTDPSGRFSIEAVGEAERSDVTFTPVTTAQDAPNLSLQSEDAAAIAPNTYKEADAIVRPKFAGLMTFQDIRNAEAPEVYSWEVDLYGSESLKLLDEHDAAVYYEDGTEAVLITPTPAHDASGAAVSTTLTVSEGNVLSLIVHHRTMSGVRYPVVTGAAFTVGYEQVQVTEPPPPPDPTEPPQPEAEGPVSRGPLLVSAPMIVPQSGEYADEASASFFGARYIKTWGQALCAPLSCEVWEVFNRGFYYYNFQQAWYKRQPVCWHNASPGFSVDEAKCEWVGGNHQPYGAGYHLTSQVFWYAGVNYAVAEKKGFHAITYRMFGDGNIFVHETTNVCNPSRPGC